MKKLFLILSLLASMNVYADKPETPTKAEPGNECKVLLAPDKEWCSGKNVVECYIASWGGGSEKYNLTITLTSCGVNSTCYTYNYTQQMGSNSGMTTSTFNTKSEAISHFVKNVFGSSCSYSYK